MVALTCFFKVDVCNICPLDHCPSIHPLSIPTYTRRVTRTFWSLSQLSLSERQEYTLDRPPVHRRATYRRATTRTHIHAYGQFRITNYPDMHVFGLWEEAGVWTLSRAKNKQYICEYIKMTGPNKAKHEPAHLTHQSIPELHTTSQTFLNLQKPSTSISNHVYCFPPALNICNLKESSQPTNQPRINEALSAWLM